MAEVAKKLLAQMDRRKDEPWQSGCPSVDAGPLALRCLETPQQKAPRPGFQQLAVQHGGRLKPGT